MAVNSAPIVFGPKADEIDKGAGQYGLRCTKDNSSLQSQVHKDGYWLSKGMWKSPSDLESRGNSCVQGDNLSPVALRFSNPEAEVERGEEQIDLTDFQKILELLIRDASLHPNETI